MSVVTPSSPGREILPQNVYPDHYHVTLEPDFEKFTFDGTVVIDLDVRETSKTVTLNIFEIDVKSVKIDGEAVVKTERNEERQEITFHSAKELVKGSKATIEIVYVGILNDQMAGFYRSTYKDDEGNTKYLATTQFEATDARRAFPCFDEPAIKSVFSITLIADKELTTLANSLPAEEKDLGNGKKAVTFAPTPVLSSYLVAFIVGDLRYVENNDYKIPVRVYTTPGLEHEGEFSAALAAKTLKFFAEAFDIEYYMSHMNMVAIHDFSAGAMENLSLVTYRTADLLLDEKNASLTKKLRVSEVVQHELAHQWFGNLVTMKWWNDLWLNESYATYCSYMVFESDSQDPTFIFQNFEADTLSSAFRLDGLRSSHPIEVDVKKASDINQIFDAISYSKGSSLLRMLAHWLGKDVFLKGVSNYLKKHKFSNAETADLWAALTEASGKDVLKVMDIWTKNVGYPVVTVKEDGNKITLTQNRFLSTGDVKAEDDKTLYPIFVNLKTKDGVDTDLRLESREISFKVDDASFFKINADAVGFYKTLYTPERWVKLGDAGNKGLLSVEDRTLLVEDAFSLSVSGYHSTTNFLNLVSTWDSEKDYIVWSSIIGCLHELRNVFNLKSSKFNDALNALIRKLIAANVEKNDWVFNSEAPVLDQRLKSLLFSAAASSGIPSVLDIVKEKFAKYIAGDKDAINNNIKNSVFSAISKQGGEEEYEQIFNIYKNSPVLEDRLFALRNLGYFKDEKLIAKTLKYALDPEIVKPQDVFYPLGMLGSHREGALALWKWLQDNYDLLTKKFPPNLTMFPSIVYLCTSNYLVDGGREEIESFFSTKDLTGFDQNLKQALDSREANYQWLKRDEEVVAKWLEENGYTK